MNYNENQKQQTSDASAPRRQPEDKSRADKLLGTLPFVIFLPIALIYIELVTHIAAFSEIEPSFFVYATFFSVAGAMVAAILCTIFSRKINFYIIFDT